MSFADLFLYLVIGAVIAVFWECWNQVGRQRELDAHKKELEARRERAEAERRAERAARAQAEFDEMMRRSGL